jgi:hypothetical protein
MLLLVVLSACSFGVAEYQLYSNAFDTQFTQGEQVLNKLAAAERVVARRTIAPRSGIADFDPDNAPYYVDAGDPPVTGAIRQALVGLKAYNDALTGLASGESSDAMVNRIGTIVGNLTGALGSLGAASILPGLAGGAALGEQMNGTISSVLPLFKTIAGLAARENFRRRLIATHPKMEALLKALREGTPAMFELFKRSYVQRGSLDGTLGISAENAKAMEADRKMLAGWVILMDKSLEAMNAATLAAMRGASSTDLAALSEASVQLRVLAEQVKSIQKP